MRHLNFAAFVPLITLLVLAGMLLLLIVTLARAARDFFYRYFLPIRLPDVLAQLRADNKTVNLARWKPRVIWWRLRWRWGYWLIVMRTPTDLNVSMMEANMESIRLELGFEPIFSEIKGWRCNLVQAVCITGRAAGELSYEEVYGAHAETSDPGLHSVHHGHAEAETPAP